MSHLFEPICVDFVAYFRVINIVLTIWRETENTPSVKEVGDSELWCGDYGSPVVDFSTGQLRYCDVRRCPIGSHCYRQPTDSLPARCCRQSKCHFGTIVFNDYTIFTWYLTWFVTAVSFIQNIHFSPTKW